MQDLVPHEYLTYFKRSPLRHCFREELMLVDGHLEEPPAARPENQPASVLHPPPANYLAPPFEPNVNCEFALVPPFFVLNVSLQMAHGIQSMQA